MNYQINRKKFMSTDETKRLLKVCEEQADLDLLKGRQTWVTRNMLVALALRSGLRVSEIAALKIGDICLSGRETRLVVRSGKGGKERDVYFTGSLTKPLKQYIEVKARSWGQPAGPGDYLFMSRDGRPYTTTALHISFKKALEKAGLPMHHSIHHARHTFATHLLADTQNLKYVQKQLGHASLAMTGLYADILPEQNQALADRLTI
jgi:site-specific recombinase XerD